MKSLMIVISMMLLSASMQSYAANNQKLECASGDGQKLVWDCKGVEVEGDYTLAINMVQDLIVCQDTMYDDDISVVFRSSDGVITVVPFELMKPSPMGAINYVAQEEGSDLSFMLSIVMNPTVKINATFHILNSQLKPELQDIYRSMKCKRQY